MTALQVKSLTTVLLLATACLFSCQGADARTKIIYLCRGGDYHSGSCPATSVNSLLYWKWNDTYIFSDNDAEDIGVNISQDVNKTGKLYRSLTKLDVQDPVNVSCLEGERVLLSESIRIKDVCDPPSVTDNMHVYGSQNLTNTTTGSKSCDKSCRITAAVMVTVLVVGTVTAIAVAIYCTCRYRCQRNRLVNDVERQNNACPPGGHDDNSGDDDNDSSGDGQGNCAIAVAPEDVTKGTMHRLPGRPIRDPPRLNNSRTINGQRGPQANSTSESAVDVKRQFGIVENNDGTRDVTTSGEQCTDESEIDPIFCYKDEIHVRGSVDISSYKKATYRVNPQTLRREEMLTV